METNDIQLRPTAIFALIKILPLILLTAGLLFLAWELSPLFIFFGIFTTGIALYRYVYIRNLVYLITFQYVRISKGIFFKRVDQVEMYRIKDYIITQPPVLQLFRLMNVTLKSTDRENPVIWLRGIPRSDLIDEIRGRVQEARKHNQIYEIN
jgi:uncharacterized membrane protein YdbT with pleckstrin-like domain